MKNKELEKENNEVYKTTFDADHMAIYFHHKIFTKVKNSYLIRTYGITSEDWWLIFLGQEFACGICKMKVPRLCVDHIHVRGFKKMPPEEKRVYVRGLLCFHCNTGIKGFEKTIDGYRNRNQFEGTVQYFKQYKLKGEI